MSFTKEEYDLIALVLEQYAIPNHSLTPATAQELNETIRQRLVPRNRFTHDHHDTCMYIARSKNLNVVAYTANLLEVKEEEEEEENIHHETKKQQHRHYHPNHKTYTKVTSGAGKNCIVDPSDGIHAYFVNLEPSYIAARRQKGIEYDCDDLNYLERTMAYGCSIASLTFLSVFNECKVTGDLAKQATNDTSVAAFMKEIRVRSPAVNAWLEEDEANGNHAHQEELLNWLSDLRPSFAKFVALPTWPGLMLCLPPLAKKKKEVKKKEGKETDTTVTTTVASDAKDERKDLNEAEKLKEQKEGEEEETKKKEEEETDFFSNEDTVVAILTTVMGELSVLDHVYVASIEPKHFYQLPSVEYIEAFGVNVLNGVPTHEPEFFLDVLFGSAELSKCNKKDNEGKEKTSSAARNDSRNSSRQEDAEEGSGGASPLNGPPNKGMKRSSSTIIFTPQNFNAYVRGLLPERGNRFRHDDLDTSMYIERSKNLNVVVYTSKYSEEETVHRQTEDGEEVKVEYAKDGMKILPDSVMDKPVNIRRTVNTKEPLHAFWIKLEPEHVERRRQRGEMHDHNELNMIEKKMAYGCNVRLFSDANSFLSELKKEWSSAIKEYQTKKKQIQKQMKDGNKSKDKKNRKGGEVEEKEKEEEEDGTNKTKEQCLNERIMRRGELFMKEDCARWTSTVEEEIKVKWFGEFQISLAKFVALDTVVLLHLPPLKEGSCEGVAAAAAAAEEEEDAQEKEEENKTKTKAKNGKADQKNNESHKNPDNVTLPVMLAMIDGCLSIVHKVYVASIEPKHFYQLPSVEYIEAFGVDLLTGKDTYEKRTNKK